MKEPIPSFSPDSESDSLKEISSEREHEAPNSLEELMKGGKKQDKRAIFKEFEQKKNGKKEKAKQKKKSESIRANFSQLSYSWLYRSFRSIFSILILILTLFMSVVFAWEKEDTVSTLSLFTQAGSVFLSDEFRDEKKSVESSPYYISSGERVTTDTTAEITLNFEEKGELRGYDQIDFIFYNEQGPEIKIFNGDFWIFSPKKTIVTFGPYAFTVQDGSARFIVRENIVVVKSHENSLQAVLQDADTGKELHITLAPMSQALFPASLESIPEMSTLQQLRFSKLLKEFHITGITEDTRDKRNIRHDTSLSQQIAEQTFHGKTKDRKLWNFVNNSLSLFTRQRHEAREKQAEEKYANILQSLFLGEIEGINEISFKKDKNEDLIEFLWQLQMMEDVAPATNLRHRIEDIILQSQNTDRQRIFRDIVFQNAVHALQEAFIKKDKEWSDLETQRIQSLWDNVYEDYSHTSSFLSFYREVFFRLFLSYPEQVSIDLFAFLDSLDSSEIAVATQSEETTTIVEIIQKNLALSQALTVSKNLTLAKDVLKNAEKKIEQARFLENDPTYQKMLQQKENVIVRLEACRTFEECTNIEFAEWRQRQKELACHIYEICQSVEFSEWFQSFVQGETLKAAPIDLDEQPEEMDIKAIGQQMLQSAGITLKSGHAVENNFFFIAEAVTQKGFTFSSSLSVQHGYLKDISLLQDPRIDIPGVHALETIDRIIAATLSPEEDTSEEEYPEEAPPGQDILDPVVADVAIRNLQKKLSENGIRVLLEDMNPLSTRNVIVDHALTSQTQIPVQFEYVFQNSQNEHIIRNLILKEYPETIVEEVLLEKLLQQIRIVNEEGERDALILQMTRDLLGSAKFIMPEEGGFSLQIQGSYVAFSGLRDTSGKTLEGTIDVNTDMFVTIKHTNGFWSYQNIPIDQYHEISQSPRESNKIVEEIPEEDLEIIDDILNQEIPNIPEAPKVPEAQQDLAELPPN